MKNPFNWAGNKYNYLKFINEVLINQKYNTVYDLFMGSGNIITNIDVQADLYIGNDITPLLPNIFSAMSSKCTFTKQTLKNIICKWNNFKDKKDYYDFRDYWNEKYLANNYDEYFIYETILLLKMCSNSMVRFNRKEGYFNQGFRGISPSKTEFFSESSKNNIVSSLNQFQSIIQQRKYKFKTLDFKLLLPQVNKEDLVILDPPYLLSSSMYGVDYTENDDEFIYNFLKHNDVDFILFNYLKNGDKINNQLDKFINENNISVKNINTKNSTGQNRKENKNVNEIMAYRITIKCGKPTPLGVG